MRSGVLPVVALVTLNMGAVQAAGLPDTGQDKCYDGTSLVPCSLGNSGDTAAYPRQDGRFGRDAKAASGTLAKTGGGTAGFDYSKIANNGTDLGAGAGLPLGNNPGDWACTRDNTTGLTWEVKSASGLRGADHTYTWYSTDVATNGGIVGIAGNGATCGNTLGTNTCNTQNYVAAVNAAALCARTDWRLPTQRELQTLIHAGARNPAIDSAYFPNTTASTFWSGSSFVPDPTSAWYVGFSNGSSGAGNKADGNRVRLVRGPKL